MVLQTVPRPECLFCRILRIPPELIALFFFVFLLLLSFYSPTLFPNVLEELRARFAVKPESAYEVVQRTRSWIVKVRVFDEPRKVSERVVVDTVRVGKRHGGKQKQKRMRMMRMKMKR
jgi:hypothetical protein